jgi:hypothetical protein
MSSWSQIAAGAPNPYKSSSGAGASAASASAAAAPPAAGPPVVAPFTTTNFDPTAASLYPPSSEPSSSVPQSSSKTRTTTTTRTVNILWPSAYPTLSDYIEQSLLPFVLPGNFHDWKKRTYPLHACDLDISELSSIFTICCNNNIDLAQAMSIRSALLRSAVPWRYNVTYAQEEAAIAFEQVVANFLRSYGVTFKTQEEQTAEAIAKRAAARGKGASATEGKESGRVNGPTPDFLIDDDCALFINGKRVKYIEVKRFYGTGIGTREGLKPWSPSIKIVAQAEKYVKVFGEDGAFIIQHGFAEQFKNRLPSCIQLLDAGPFIEQVEASDAEVIEQQLRQGLIPHGKTGNKWKDDQADAIWYANFQKRLSSLHFHDC